MSHLTTPLSVRGRFTSKRTLRRVNDLLPCQRMTETVVVATCNRLEVYSVGESADDLIATTLEIIREASGTDMEALRNVVYTYSGADAIRHLFRVASSLDSLMVGEGQILGQVRDALASSEENGTSGPVLGRRGTGPPP